MRVILNNLISSYYLFFLLVRFSFSFISLFIILSCISKCVLLSNKSLQKHYKTKALIKYVLAEGIKSKMLYS